MRVDPEDLPFRHADGMTECWHPSSPGVRVLVPNRPKWKRSPFASLYEMNKVEYSMDRGDVWDADPTHERHEFELKRSDASFCKHCWGPEESPLHERDQEVLV